MHYGRLQSRGLYDQSHDQSDSACMHHTYIQNLGKQYWWTCLQRRNGDADVGNGLVERGGKERLGQTEKVVLMYIHSLTLKVTQMCLTLWDLMNYSPPGSSVHGISQAKILRWVAIPISRRSSQSRDQTWVSFIAGRFFTIWTTKEAPCMLITCGRLLYSTGNPTWSSVMT